MKINKYLKIIFIIIFIGLAGYAGYYLYNYFNPHNHHQNKENQLWTCPMHPQIIQKEPGKCPICHMDLVPLEDHTKKDKVENTQNNTTHSMNGTGIQIRLDPAMIQKIGLKTQIVEKKQVERTISLVGHVDYDEKNIFIINSRISGWAEKLYATYNGKYVKKGEILLALYSPDLLTTQEEYLQLYKQYINAKKTIPSSDPIIQDLHKTLISSRERLKLWNISEFQIQQIENKLTTQRLLYITTPYSGFIIEKNVIEGQKIEEGMNLFKIANIEKVWVIVHVPEKDIPFVFSGQKAKIKINQIPDKIYEGKVSFIYPYISETTRDLTIRIEISNQNFGIKPGMYASIELYHKSPEKLLVIPYSSVIQTGKRNISFVHKGSGVIEPVIVEPGFTDGESWIEIKKGLQEGDEVVTSAQFLLDSETRIQEAILKMKNDQLNLHQH